MEKKHAEIYVMMNGILLDRAESMEGVNEILDNLAEGNDTFDFSPIKLLNVVDEMESLDYAMKYTEGPVDMGEASETSLEDSVVYTIEDYSDREFDSEEEVRDYILKRVKDGIIDIEEAKKIAITRTSTNELMFDGACTEGGEWRLDVENLTIADAKLYDRMGIEFIPAHPSAVGELELAIETDEERAQRIAHIEAEVNKRLIERIETSSLMNMVFNPEEMTDQRLIAEIAQLNERLFELQAERKNRIIVRANANQ